MIIIITSTISPSQDLLAAVEGIREFGLLTAGELAVPVLAVLPDRTPPGDFDRFLGIFN